MLWYFIAGALSCGAFMFYIEVCSIAASLRSIKSSLASMADHESDDHE